MPRLLPSQIKKISEMLDEPADDAEELAKRILTYVREDDTKRDAHILAYRIGHGEGDPPYVYWCYGPFSTKNQCLKFAGKLANSGNGDQAMVMRLYHPEGIKDV